MSANSLSTNPGMDKQHPIFENIQIGIGTWSWGDRLYWGFGRNYNEQDCQSAFNASINAGIFFFDTAEIYGQGQSEKYLGEFLKSTSTRMVIATKFMPFPWKLSRSSLTRALHGSLKRLDLKSVDLYQMHQPLPPVTVETWMSAMTEAHQSGLISAVGVSNYNRELTQRAYDALAQEGIQLASNQVEYHLLNRKIEKNGVYKLCKELGITIIAYSPLASGVLTGKYTPENPPTGFRGRRYDRKFLGKIKSLLTQMNRIGADHGGKNSAQVALNWLICKGTIPIPGAKNAQQAEQNVGAIGWQLTEEEVAQLDEVSIHLNEE